jgi:hypothetical protein
MRGRFKGPLFRNQETSLITILNATSSIPKGMRAVFWKKTSQFQNFLFLVEEYFETRGFSAKEMSMFGVVEGPC